jgi:hypothetical protein
MVFKLSSKLLVLYVVFAVDAVFLFQGAKSRVKLDHLSGVKCIQVIWPEAVIKPEQITVLGRFRKM